jgi:hypothetical protein
LFSTNEEREACRKLWLLTRDRTDEEMRSEVAAHLRREREWREAEEKRRATARQEEAKREAAAKQAEANRSAAAKAAASRREQELKTGGVGFSVDRFSLGGFGTVMLARVTLQNNTAAPVKDFVIHCLTYGASGTQLSTAQTTLYQALAGGKRGSFEVNMGMVNSQSERASCSLAKWSAG